MNQKRTINLQSAFIRLASIAIFTAFIGAAVGVGHAYAEILSSVYVPGAGNVGYAGTYGYSAGGIKYAIGRSTSSTNLYHTFAGVRFWHDDDIMSQSNRNWFNSQGGYTSWIASAGYGDKATNRSTFRYTTPYHSSIYYTSWPDYSASCSAHWYYGNDC